MPGEKLVKPPRTYAALNKRELTGQVDGLVSQEEAPGDAPAVPGSREGQDLAQSPHVVLEGRRANVTHG